jgi:hypothetical protein
VQHRTRATAVLVNRHRGKGPQKLTVDHVYPGGQAIVGIVESPGGGVKQIQTNTPKELTHEP